MTIRDNKKIVVIPVLFFEFSQFNFEIIKLSSEVVEAVNKFDGNLFMFI